jgi:hypothetical protein
VLRIFLDLMEPSLHQSITAYVLCQVKRFHSFRLSVCITVKNFENVCVHTGFDIDINVVHTCCSVRDGNETQILLSAIVKYPVSSSKNSESYKI